MKELTNFKHLIQLELSYISSIKDLDPLFSEAKSGLKGLRHVSLDFYFFGKSYCEFDVRLFELFNFPQLQSLRLQYLQNISQNFLNECFNSSQKSLSCLSISNCASNYETIQNIQNLSESIRYLDLTSFHLSELVTINKNFFKTDNLIGLSVGLRIKDYGNSLSFVPVIEFANNLLYLSIVHESLLEEQLLKITTVCKRLQVFDFQYDSKIDESSDNLFCLNMLNNLHKSLQYVRITLKSEIQNPNALIQTIKRWKDNIALKVLAFEMNSSNYINEETCIEIMNIFKDSTIIKTIWISSIEPEIVKKAIQNNNTIEETIKPILLKFISPDYSIATFRYFNVENLVKRKIREEKYYGLRIVNTIQNEFKTDSEEIIPLDQ